MKVSGPVKKITVTQSALAQAIGITRARVSQMVKEGTMIRNDDDQGGGILLFDSLKNYYGHYTQPVATGSDDDVVDYYLEKAKHEKASREIAELKLAKLKARVYDARTVELVMTEMLSNLRTQLLGLPSKMAPILEGKSKEEIYESMTHEIEDKLSELSAYKPELFTEEEIADEESD